MATPRRQRLGGAPGSGRLQLPDEDPGEPLRPLRGVDEEQHRVEQLQLEQRRAAVVERDHVHAGVGRRTEQGLGHLHREPAQAQLRGGRRRLPRHLVPHQAFGRADAAPDHRVLVDGVAEDAAEEDESPLAHGVDRSHVGLDHDGATGRGESVDVRPRLVELVGLVASRLETAARDRRLHDELTVSEGE